MCHVCYSAACPGCCHIYCTLQCWCIALDDALLMVSAVTTLGNWLDHWDLAHSSSCDYRACPYMYIYIYMLYICIVFVCVCVRLTH